MASTIRVPVIMFVALSFVGCSSSLVAPLWADNDAASYSSSGTLIVSAQVPHESAKVDTARAQLARVPEAPIPGVLLGYFAPHCASLTEPTFASKEDDLLFTPVGELPTKVFPKSGTVSITGSIASLVDVDEIKTGEPVFISSRTKAAADTSAGENNGFTRSGSVVLTSQVPSEFGHGVLLGYIPPVVGFLPASNQVWAELDRSTKELTILRGRHKIAVIDGFGSTDIDPGTYSVQHKIRNGGWFAPDSYFTKRGLSVPSGNEPPRYRRGALGKYALYVTPTYAIHSSLVYSPEVGGLRVSPADLASIYYLMPLGSSIKVK